MPEYQPIAKNLEEKARRLREMLQRGDNPWAGLLTEILLGMSKNTKDIYRKLMNEGAPSGTGGAGGGGGGQGLIPICSFVYETERIGLEQLEDGSLAFRPMQSVTYSKWEREPVKQLHGVSGSHVPRRVIGHLWLETLDGGLTEKQYFIDMRPATSHGTISDTAVLGFAIGFGRYGAERLQFRLDMLEYRRQSTTAEIASLTNEVNKTSKWQTQEGASPATGLITDALLAKYQTEGLRVKCSLTVWGT